MFHEPMQLRGHFKLFKNGLLMIDKPNLIVNAGKTLGVTRLVADAPSKLIGIAVGSSGTAPAAGDTALGAEIARLAFDSAPGVVGATVSMITTFSAGQGTGTWQEACLTNSLTPAGSIMFSRVTFTAIPKGAGDQFSIQWSITCT